ncbi:hypothetical protein KCU90_g227, partial [Aureobasidium melanogenum]
MPIPLELRFPLPSTQKAELQSRRSEKNDQSKFEGDQTEGRSRLLLANLRRVEARKLRLLLGSWPSSLAWWLEELLLCMAFVASLHCAQQLIQRFLLMSSRNPAAFESVLDSIRGVVTQGFLFLEGAMLVMAYGVSLLRIEEVMIKRKGRCCCRSLG